MSEKQWTDDERSEAFERGLRTMEGIALELYRRGREPLLEELETVKRERDEARADAERYLADLRRCASEPYERTRELEALQAEVERLREMAHDFEAMREDRDEARAERDAAIARITEVGVMVATNGNLLAKDAYRRGAEAMREACAQWFREHDESFELTVDACHDVIADMPIPEEP